MLCDVTKGSFTYRKLNVFTGATNWKETVSGDKVEPWWGGHSTEGAHAPVPTNTHKETAGERTSLQHKLRAWQSYRFKSVHPAKTTSRPAGKGLSGRRASEESDTTWQKTFKTKEEMAEFPDLDRRPIPVH